MKFEKPTVKAFNHRTYMEYANYAKQLTDEYLCEHYPEQFKPELMVNLTTPGQSITVKQLMVRYEKGRPVPVE